MGKLTTHVLDTASGNPAQGVRIRLLRNGELLADTLTNAADTLTNAAGKLLTHSASTYAIPAFSDAPPDFRVALLTEAMQPNTIHGSKAVGEPPLMLAISVREAIRDAVSCFETETGFLLPSPCTGEAVKSVIDATR